PGRVAAGGAARLAARVGALPAGARRRPRAALARFAALPAGGVAVASGTHSIVAAAGAGVGVAFRRSRIFRRAAVSGAAGKAVLDPGEEARGGFDRDRLREHLRGLHAEPALER